MQIVQNEVKRRTFIGAILDFLRTYKLDGIDIYWEYPGLRGGHPSDKVKNYNTYV